MKIVETGSWMEPFQFHHHNLHSYILFNGRNVVGAYTLLPNKRLDSYAEMLNEIKNLTNGVNPESIMIDFEN